MLLVSWRHFCVGFLTVNFVLRSDTFFPQKICNKYTNIYGGTKEFRKISTFSKFKILKNFTPFLGPGSLAPLFSKLLSSFPGSIHVSTTFPASFFTVNSSSFNTLYSISNNQD